jgi:hypothetical protein
MGQSTPQYLHGAPNSSHDFSDLSDIQAQGIMMQNLSAELISYSFDSLGGSSSSVAAGYVSDWDINSMRMPEVSAYETESASFADNLYTSFLDADIGLTKEDELLDIQWISLIQDTGILDNHFSI